MILNYTYRKICSCTSKIGVKLISQSWQPSNARVLLMSRHYFKKIYTQFATSENINELQVSKSEALYMVSSCAKTISQNSCKRNDNCNVFQIISSTKMNQIQYCVTPYRQAQRFYAFCNIMKSKLLQHAPVRPNPSLKHSCKLITPAIKKIQTTLRKPFSKLHALATSN